MKAGIKFELFFFSFIFFSSSLAQEFKAEFSATFSQEKHLNYILDIPADISNPYPLIIFLHGAGERGTDLEKVKTHGIFTNKNLFPEKAAILAPQCPEGVYWDTQAIYLLIQEIIKKYPIDKNRIYLTGLSMGGWGSWKLAEEHPEIFAAVAPVCAPLHRPALSRACDIFAEKPIWIFHGALDDVVPLDDSTIMFQKLKSCSEKVNYTIFEEDNHNSWDSTYSNPEFYSWLFKQKLNH